MKDTKQKERNLKIAEELKDYLIKNELTTDLRIYFNNICWDFDSYGKMKVIEDIKASDYFEYAIDDSISVSTEGGLYDEINMCYGCKVYDELCELFEKHNAYFELGNAWNFSVVYD